MEYGEKDFTAASGWLRKQLGLPEHVVLDPNDPMRSARKYVADNFIKDGIRTLHRHRGAFWRWTGSYFQLAEDEDVRAGIWAFLETAMRMEKEKLVPFKPNRDRVGNVLDALNAVVQLDKYIEPPAWLATAT